MAYINRFHEISRGLARYLFVVTHSYKKINSALHKGDTCEGSVQTAGGMGFKR